MILVLILVEYRVRGFTSSAFTSNFILMDSGGDLTFSLTLALALTLVFISTATVVIVSSVNCRCSIQFCMYLSVNTFLLAIPIMFIIIEGNALWRIGKLTCPGELTCSSIKLQYLVRIIDGTGKVIIRKCNC